MPSLMDGYSTRPPTLEDAEAVARLIAACELAGSGKAEMTAEEVLDDWHGLDLSGEAIAVYAPNGEPAGYADVDNHSYVAVSVYGYVHPEHRGRGIGNYLVNWGESWTRDHMDRTPEGSRVIVRHYVIAENEGARRLLEDSGYAPLRGNYVMAIDMEEAPPPDWPDGLSVRAFSPGRDEGATFEAVEDAFQDVWGRPRGTFEPFVKMTGAEGFDPELWFLAVDGDETCGVCLGKKVAGRGWVDVVGVRRPWRSRGVGLALLRHAFGEFYQRGVTRVELSVDAESLTGAPRLYWRAGMSVIQSYVLYQKELRSGRDLSTSP